MKKFIFFGAVLTAGIVAAKAQSGVKSDELKISYIAQNNPLKQHNIEAPQYSQPEFILDESTPTEKTQVIKRKKRLFSFKKAKNRSSSGRF